MSDAAAFEFVAPLTVCVDFKNPFAYLAVEPTRALEQRLGLTADWLPLIVAPLSRPKAAAPSDDRGTRHRRIRAEYFERDLARYARARGLDIGDCYRSLDVTMAAVGLEWLRRTDRARAGRYVEAMFSHFWQRGASSASEADVRAALIELGANGERFAADVAVRGAAWLAALQSSLAAAGLFTVPSYVVEGEVFVGRQHLPMVEWLLTGRRGPPPI
jgi:2-hydroxychromene-2-carboxylate isomerase